MDGQDIQDGGWVSHEISLNCVSPNRNQRAIPMAQSRQPRNRSTSGVSGSINTPSTSKPNRA